MRAVLTICFLFLFWKNSPAQAQSNSIHFTVKTDALALFESAIDKKITVLPVALKICFGKAYGLQFGARKEKRSEDSFNVDELSLTGEARWHVVAEDNSILHFGPYLSWSSIMASDNYTKYQNYNWEPGICAGYQTIIGKHFVINPEVYAGIENTYRSKVFEGGGILNGNKSGELAMRICAWVGYKF